MTEKTVEFLFDFVSPTSYLAYMVLPKLVDRADAMVTWTPVFLGGIMQATGNRPPGTVDNKRKWMAADMARWVSHYGIPYRRNSYFPVNTLAILRGAIAYMDDPVIRPYCDAMFHAMWVEDRNLAEPAEIAAVLETLGMDPHFFNERIADQAVKDKLKANTDGAVERGVFGAPTFFVGDNMHFGQDRLWMVAEDLGIPVTEAFSLMFAGATHTAAEGETGTAA
jgi:2-hydroxychromene-2-carboxylate isomerase